MADLNRYICALCGFFLVLPILACSGVIQADDYLVKNQAEYQGALGKLSPGDSIILANGIWRDFEIVFEARGTAANPVTLAAQTSGKVIISGKSSLKIGGDHLVVKGLVFKDGYSPSEGVISLRGANGEIASNTHLFENVVENFNKPDRASVDSWLIVFGRNNHIDHNYFSGKTNKGPTFIVRLDVEGSDENNHLIEYNYFGMRAPLGGNGGETIRIGTSFTSRLASRTIIRRNYFERSSGEVEIISNKSEYNTITENVFYEAKGSVVFRHGGHNTISRNVFFGNGVPDTGGIRVINDNQTIADNYLEGVRGHKFLGALVIMNGVPNSPQNRYHQVENANVRGNSFIDIAKLGLAVGADEERSAPPINSKVNQNLFVSNSSKLLNIFDDISGIEFGNNVSNRDDLETLGARFDKALSFERADNGLLYPLNDTGVGAPRDLRPISRDETGPTWYQKPPQKIESTRIVAVGPDAGALVDAVAQAMPGDTLMLSAGSYALKSPLEINSTITLKGADVGEAVISSSGGSAFHLLAGADLTVEGLKLLQTSGSEPFFSAPGENYKGAYTLTVKDVEARGNDNAHHGAFLSGSANSFGEHIEIDGLTLSKWNGPVVHLSGDGLEGWYLTDTLNISNSVFSDVSGELVVLGREGRDESTFGPRFTLRNSVIRHSGSVGGLISLNGIDGFIVENASINNSGAITVKQRVLGHPFIFSNNALTNTPAPIVSDVNGNAFVFDDEDAD